MRYSLRVRRQRWRERTVDVDLIAGDGGTLAVDCGYDFGFEVL